MAEHLRRASIDVNAGVLAAQLALAVNKTSVLDRGDMVRRRER
jgi:hypothetical protein